MQQVLKVAVCLVAAVSGQAPGCVPRGGCIEDAHWSCCPGLKPRFDEKCLANAEGVSCHGPNDPTPPPPTCHNVSAGATMPVSRGGTCAFQRGTWKAGSWDHVYYTGSPEACCAQRRTFTTWCEYDTVFFRSADPSKKSSFCASWKKGALKHWIPDPNGPHIRLVRAAQTIDTMV